MENNNIVYGLKVGDFLVFESSDKAVIIYITEIKRTTFEYITVSFLAYDMKCFSKFNSNLFVKNEEGKTEFIFNFYFSDKLTKVNKKECYSYFFDQIDSKMFYFQKFANDFLMELNEYDKKRR